MAFDETNTVHPQTFSRTSLNHNYNNHNFVFASRGQEEQCAPNKGEIHTVISRSTELGDPLLPKIYNSTVSISISWGQSNLKILKE